MPNTTEVKKWIKTALNPIDNHYGFKVGTHKDTSAYGIFKELDGVVFIIPIQTWSGGELLIGRPTIRFQKIHEVLLQLTDLEAFTVKESTFKLAHFPFEEKITINSQEHLDNYITPLKNRIEETIIAFNHWSKIENLLNHWDALEGFQKLRNDYFPSARNQHIIYFIGRLWKDARTEKWYQEAVKSIHQNIKEHPDIFGEVLSDLEKIKSTLDDNSVSELEALKKQLEVNINIPILPFVPKTHQIIKEYQTDIRVSVDYAGIHKVEYRMFSYICLLYTSPSPRDRTRSRMPSSA